MIGAGLNSLLCLCGCGVSGSGGVGAGYSDARRAAVEEAAVESSACDGIWSAAGNSEAGGDDPAAAGAGVDSDAGRPVPAVDALGCGGALIAAVGRSQD